MTRSATNRPYFNFSDRIAYCIINGSKILQFQVSGCGVGFLISIVIDGLDLVKVLFDERVYLHVLQIRISLTLYL